MKKFLCGMLLCLSFLCAGTAHAATLTSGSVTAGSIPNGGTSTQTFDGTAGQGVISTIADTFGAVSVKLYYPDGTYWETTTNGFNLSSLPYTGTYTAVLSSAYGYGSYNMYYVAGGEGVSNGALTSGATAADSLPEAGAMTSYTFSGTTGQGFQMRLAASYSSVIYVFKPDGTYWNLGYDTFSSNSLPATGTYTVAVVSRYGGYYGDYDLYYVIGAGSVSGGAISSGGSVGDTLPENGLESYTFSGTSGHAIVMTFAASYTANIYIYKPDGSYLTGFNTNRLFYNLPSTGTYTVVVAGVYYSTTGPYTLYFVESGGDETTTSQGLIGSGTSDYNQSLAANQIRSYTIAGISGQEFQINVGVPSGYTPEIYVYNPSGSFWTSAPHDFAGTFATSGNYTVVVVAIYNSDTGPYSLYYVKGDDNVSRGYLIDGHERDETMPLNGIMSYHFQGTSGKSMTIATTGVSSYAAVYYPNGSLWYSHSGGFSGTLTATGLYTATVYPTNSSYSGAFTVTVTTTQPVPPNTDPKKKHCCAEAGGDPSAGGIADTAMATGGSAYAPSPGNAPLSPAGAPQCGCHGGSGGSGGSKGGSGACSDAGAMRTNSINANGPTTTVGDPLDFDLGNIEETATDYQAGGLTFTRIYRSDSTWTDNTIGALWRTNYARTLSVTSPTAYIIDGSGAKMTYTLTGGVWVADDASNFATLQTVTGGYTYTLPNGNIENYNSSYQLTRVTFRGGGALNLTYNGSGQLTGIANENGRSLSLTYNGSGQVATLVTPDGTFSYSYDSNGNLTTVTKPDTNTIQYEYEDSSYVNALTGITDEKGVRFATFAYDASGRADSTEQAGGVNHYTVTYNADGSSTVTNPLGKEFTYYYDTIQGVRRIIEVDGAASTNTPASTEYYNYDNLGRMIGKTDRSTHVMARAVEYPAASNNATRVTYGTNTSDQQVTDPSWNSTWNVPNYITEPGKKTSFDYDSYGRLTSVTVTDTNTSEARTTTYSYYSNSTDGSGNTILGRLKTIDGPRTDVTDTTTYAYDSNFDLSTITNALSQVTTVTARDSAGRITKVTDPNGVETDYTYDSNGWLQTIVQDKGGALEATTTFTYDADGQLTKITLPNSATVQYTYDDAQRLTGIEDTLGNTITYTLDDAGDLTQTQMDDTTPTLTYTHTQTFDELARILTSVGASSQTADYAWDTNSNLTSYTDPNTNETDYAYDPLQRLYTITDALTGVTTNGYDALNNLTSVEDQRSNTTTYTYNAFGDVTGETSPNRGTISYTVDKAGNVTKRVDARSVETDYTYDALNRLTAVSYPATSSLDVSLTYDSSSGCGTPYVGHLCSVTDAAGTEAYQYDVLDRVTQEKDTRGSLNFTTDYSYDLAGNITGLTLPSGRTVTYTLNSNGQPSGVSAKVNGTDTTLASSITYLPFGPMNGMTYGNSLTFSGTYDEDYNPTNRTVSGSIYNWTYTTDDNGNITQAGPTTYGYDDLNRVDAENPGSSISYTYDATSNRLTKVSGGTTTTTVPSGSNKISAVGSNSYTYDAAGDITGDGTNTYTWNDEGELSEVKVGGSAVGDYTYNYLRQRTEKVAGSNTTQYVYGAGGLLYGEYDSSGNLIREYVYLNGAPLAQIDAGSSETLTYLHTDEIGTPRFGTDTSGNQVWSWTNDAFGTSAPSGSVTVNLRMPGQYYDSESGLFYNWNRYYNPAIGRYISSDSLGIAGGLNTFGYAGQNPVMWIDPWAFAQTLTAVVDPTQGPGVIKWHLSEVSPNGGWIVQHIVMKMTGYYEGHSYTTTLCFYEVWQVLPHSQEPFGEDQWITGRAFPHGSVETTADAQFYEGYHLPWRSAQNPNGFAYGVVPQAGIWGISTYSQPPGVSISGGSNNVHRNQIVTW
jgi:RHS repeat-associated protein